MCTPLLLYAKGFGPKLACVAPSLLEDRVSVQGKEVLTSRFPSRMLGFTVLRRPLAGGRAQTRESGMVPWLLVLVLSSPVSRRQLV